MQPVPQADQGVMKWGSRFVERCRQLAQYDVLPGHFLPEMSGFGGALRTEV
jgi:hypothetical protein